MDSLSKETLGNILKQLDKLQQAQELQLQRQSQLDHVTERLDMIQTVLETQKQRYGLLNEKLTYTDAKLDNVMAFLKDQLRFAQTDILTRIIDLKSRCCHPVKDDHLSEPESSKKQRYTGIDYENAVKEFRDRLGSLDEKMASCSNLLAEMSQKSLKLTQMSQKMEPWFETLANKFELVMDAIMPHLGKIYDMQNVIKAQTSAELVWLENEMDSALSDMATKVNEKLEMVSIKLSDLSDMMNYVQDTLYKQQETIQSSKTEHTNLLESAIKDGADDSMENLKEIARDKQSKSRKEMRVNIEEPTGKLETIAHDQEESIHDLPPQEEKKIHEKLTLIEKIVNHTNAKIVELKGNVSHIEDTIEKLDKQIQEVQTNLQDKVSVTMGDEMKMEFQKFYDTIQENIASKIQMSDDRSVNQAMDSLKQYLDTAHADIISKMEDSLHKQIEESVGEMKYYTDKNNERSVNQTMDNLRQDINTLNKEVQTFLQKQMGESVSKVEDFITDTKYDIFAVIEKEAQLVRDEVESHVPLAEFQQTEEEIYTFYFYVKDFKSLIRSGKWRKSIPWYIKKLKSSVQGYVRFELGGELKVWLLAFRHPFEVGIQPRHIDSFEVKATIADIKEKVLADMEIGKITTPLDDDGILDHSNWGYLIGKLSCDDLIQKGYAMKEGYKDRAILIKFSVKAS